MHSMQRDKNYHMTKKRYQRQYTKWATTVSYLFLFRNTRLFHVLRQPTRTPVDDAEIM